MINQQIKGIDIWGTREDTKLEETIAMIVKKLIAIEQEIYLESGFMEDKDFIRKNRVVAEYHMVLIKKLELEKKELLKLLGSYEKS